MTSVLGFCMLMIFLVLILLFPNFYGILLVLAMMVFAVLPSLNN